MVSAAERAVNVVLRYYNSVLMVIKGISLNRRFINLNIFVIFLVCIIFVQSFFLQKSSISTSANDLILLKGDSYSSHYNTLLKRYPVDTFKKFSFKKKCNLYFDELSIKNHNWRLDNFNTDGYDDNMHSFDAYLEAKQKIDPNLDLSEKKIKEYEEEYLSKSGFSDKIGGQIVDSISTLRLFGKCFIESQSSSTFSSLTDLFGDNDDSTKAESNDETSKSTGRAQDLCLDTESRIFPWLTTILPTYTRWDGVPSIGIPDMVQVTNFDKDYPSRSKLIKRGREQCFFKNFRNSINGRGYVISASDAQVGELKKLALILRANGNKLPIQIMHKGDLSEDKIKELTHEFRREISTANLPKSYEELGLSQDLSFPPQEVWYVNVRKSINSDFGKYFEKYANKLLAYLFNSFEEMILIDTDTVPFVQLSEILDYPEYISKGAYFYQDRQLRGQNTENQVEYFKRLFPSKLDHYFYDIPLVTDHTLKNRFIGDLRNHFMESGVVAIDRKRHFTGMLIGVQLNFWSPTMTKVHGDKELFWLGLSIAGDENYHFNPHGAASVGELTKNENKRLPGTSARELCSNHPGHIDSHGEKDRLVWINSGFTFCKNNAAGFDKGKPLFRGMSEADIRTLYNGVTKIRSAIIPPPQEISRHNELNNPEIGWTDEHKYCFGYTWCAYDYIGTGSQPEEIGTYVEFSEEETKWFDFIGDLWMRGAPEKKN